MIKQIKFVKKKIADLVLRKDTIKYNQHFLSNYYVKNVEPNTMYEPWSAIL